MTATLQRQCRMCVFDFIQFLHVEMHALNWNAFNELNTVCVQKFRFFLRSKRKKLNLFTKYIGKQRHSQTINYEFSNILKQNILREKKKI